MDNLIPGINYNARKMISDNIIENTFEEFHGSIDLYEKIGAIEYNVDGGWDWGTNIADGPAKNVGMHRGAGKVPLDLEDPALKVSYYPTNVIVTCQITKDELNQNEGTTKIRDLLKTKLVVLAGSANNLIEDQLISGGDEPNDLNGTDILITDDGLGDTGNIDASVYTNWQNQTRNITLQTQNAPVSGTALIKAMNQLTIDCQKAGGPIKGYLISPTPFVQLLESAWNNTRLTDGEEVDLSASRFKHGMAMVGYHKSTEKTEQTAIAISPKALKFMRKGGPGAWDFDDFQLIPGTRTYTATAGLMCQQVVLNRWELGRINIST